MSLILWSFYKAQVIDVTVLYENVETTHLKRFVFNDMTGLARVSRVYAVPVLAFPPWLQITQAKQLHNQSVHTIHDQSFVINNRAVSPRV